MSIASRKSRASTHTQVDGKTWYAAAMERLIPVVQDLSHARSMDEIAAIVRVAARELTGADGATFVLQDNGQCHYVEENAISPLWKGHRFPMESCVSGWAMMHKQPAVIPDIFTDKRIPITLYQPTFVKSMVMVPIRRDAPIGAIGNYWAKMRTPTVEEISVLQALADTTAVAIENVQLYTQLQEKIEALEKSNYELNRFAWVASHDLQEPLRTIATQVELLGARYAANLDAKAQRYIHTAAEGARRLQNLIEALLVHARVGKAANFKMTDIANLVQHVLNGLQESLKDVQADITVEPLPRLLCEPSLIALVFQNLLSNAIKFRQDNAPLHIAVGCQRIGDEWVFSVRDKGIGIEPGFEERIFGLFQRLHGQEAYLGSGIGLATCKKIIGLHHGRLWVESTLGQGSTFWFTLPATSAMEEDRPTNE